MNNARTNQGYNPAQCNGCHAAIEHLKAENERLEAQVVYLSWWVRRLDSLYSTLWASIQSAWFTAQSGWKKAKDPSMAIHPFKAWRKSTSKGHPLMDTGPYTGPKPPEGWLKVSFPLSPTHAWFPKEQVIELWDEWHTPLHRTSRTRPRVRA